MRNDELYERPHCLKYLKHLNLTKWCHVSPQNDRDNKHSHVHINQPCRHSVGFDELYQTTIIHKYLDLLCINVIICESRVHSIWYFTIFRPNILHPWLHCLTWSSTPVVSPYLNSWRTMTSFFQKCSKFAICRVKSKKKFLKRRFWHL